MSWLDVSTYIVQNCGGFIAASLISLLAGLVVAGIICIEAKEENFKFYFVTTWLVFWLFGAFIGLFSLLPSHDRILRVKISRIKNEAVNKENISKGVETLERIGHKLECKYLGCDKQEEKR